MAPSVIYEFFLCFFSNFFASIVLQKNPLQKIIFSIFISLFLFPFFRLLFSPDVLPRRSDGRGQDTSPRELSESSGGNGHQDLKRRSLAEPRGSNGLALFQFLLSLIAPCLCPFRHVLVQMLTCVSARSVVLWKLSPSHHGWPP